MGDVSSHAVSQVIRQLLIDLSLGANGGTTWPVYATQAPDLPDDLIAVYDTVGRSRGRTSVGGEVYEGHGIQIDVRADDLQTGIVKANTIKVGLTEDVHLTTVTVTDDEDYGTATVSYALFNVKWISGPFPRPDPDTNRKIHSLNFLVTIREN